jgi:hypothetical protein
MLPSLGALSLGAPTGAKDDVVTEIRDEQVEADKRSWEAWHEEHEMEEAEDADRQAMREQSLTAFSRAAAAADSSGDSSDDEPLDRRADRLAPKTPPIYTLKQDPFSIIVDELAKRLTPDAATIKHTDPKSLCREVEKACRELATLNRLPGLAVDPRYDCYDPNAPVWKAALVIFGVNPKKRTRRLNSRSWKGHFRDLCAAFNPGYAYVVFESNNAGGGHWGDGHTLWGTLWDADEKGHFHDHVEYNQSRARGGDWRRNGFEYYKDLAVPLLQEVRRPIRRGSSQIAWRIQHMPVLREAVQEIRGRIESDYRDCKSTMDNWEECSESESDDCVHLPCAPSYYDFDYPGSVEDYRNEVNRLYALQFLFETLENQARAMQAAAS